MSWNNCIPLWVILSELEEQEAKILGAFQEELNAGIVRSLPDYIADIRRRVYEYDL